MPKKKTKPTGRLIRSAGGPEESFGSRLKTLRQDASLSIRDLAQRCGVGSSALQKYEVGTSLPGASELRKLSEVFGESAHFLVFGGPWSDSNGADAESFFGSSDEDLYIARFGCALRALPAADRMAVERLVGSLLVAAVGPNRLGRVREAASQWIFRLLESGGEVFPAVGSGVPWDDGGFSVAAGQEKPVDSAD